MKRCIFSALTLLLLSLALPALAVTTEGNFVTLPEAGIKIFLKNTEEWTIVTSDNLDENMPLILSRGETEENARMRFAEGHVLFEAFNDRFPDGRMRLEVFETIETRNVWCLEDITLGQLDKLGETLKEELFCNRYHIIRDDLQRYDASRRGISGAMIAMPPYQYESGMFVLNYFNGKAYMYSYVQSTIASAPRYFKTPDLWQEFQACMPINFSSFLTGKNFQKLTERLSPVADLSYDPERLVLNAHSGAFTMTGMTEKLATVKVSLNGVETKAKVDDKGKYKCEVSLTPGDNEIISFADKKNLRQNTLSYTISVDDGMAALELNEVPYGYADRAKLIVRGVVSPGAKLLLQIDDGDIIEATVDDKGKFKEKLTAADWEEHVLTVTAREEGLEDCVAEFNFVPQYNDAQKGIYAFNKVRDKEVKGLDIPKDPIAYVGKKVLVIAKVTEITYGDGMLTILAQVEKPSQSGYEVYNGGAVYFIADSYLNDVVNTESVIYVYGTVLEPSMTEPPVPRISVEYVSYYK